MMQEKLNIGDLVKINNPLLADGMTSIGIITKVGDTLTLPIVERYTVYWTKENTKTIHTKYSRLVRVSPAPSSPTEDGEDKQCNKKR